MTVEALSEYGMERMDDEEIDRFLAAQNLGVLGLPSEGSPYLLPMSYGFDEGAQLYFFFLVGDRSRKVELASQAETATFLVYNAETMFHWRSVLLSGTIRSLSEEELPDLTDTQAPAWRPEVIQAASETEETRVFTFEIEESTGIRHDIQPPSYPFHQRSSRDGAQ